MGLITFFKKWYASIMLLIAFLGLVFLILAWQFPKTSKENNSENGDEMIQEYDGSVYNLIKITRSESTTLKREELAEKYGGLKVTDRGYIHDVRDADISGLGDLGVNIFIASSTELVDLTFVSCTFDEEWRQKLETINLADEILFEGIINPRYDALGLILDDCRLLEGN